MRAPHGSRGGRKQHVFGIGLDGSKLAMESLRGERWHLHRSEASLCFGMVLPICAAGYKEWERHGRTVLRGEHALWVIAPRTSRVQQVTLPDGTRQQVPLGWKLPRGAVDDGKKTIIVGWRGQAVFDVSQTQGTPLLVPRTI
jgi:hypothetical protein